MERTCSQRERESKFLSFRIPLNVCPSIRNPILSVTTSSRTCKKRRLNHNTVTEVYRECTSRSHCSGGYIWRRNWYTERWHGWDIDTVVSMLSHHLVGKKNPQKLIQFSPRSHPRHLVGKMTAQNKTPTIKDITSDSQVKSNYPYGWLLAI